MKKAITRIIIVLIVVNLITTGLTLAQDVIEKEIQPASKEAVAVEKKIEIERKKAEIAAEVAQKEAEITASLQKQLEATQKQMQAKLREVAGAQKQMVVAEKQMQDQQSLLQELQEMVELPSVANIRMPVWQHSGSSSVLIIPSAEMQVENLAAISEDMNVMSRIFDKQLSQLNEQTPGGILFGQLNPYFERDHRTTEAIYLEGYGALFLMNVNMLLSAPPEAQQKAEEETDPVWSQMRREMYEPEETRRSRAKERPEVKYDALMVGNLKATLIKTLKHATNIHALKPEQLVILTVIGSGRRSASAITQSFSYGRSTGSRNVVQTVPEGETNSLLPTVLTICAKKSDIDAFAAGELDYDQFRQRTGIFKSYAKAGQQDSPVAHEHEVAHEEHQIAYGDRTAF
ncbi:MAG: hypothetical protein RQ760_08155 [Sedimentisphaerales bacterium]|nr:hypothetical protein [Sedimentisphaerales bacterium]